MAHAPQAPPAAHVPPHAPQAPPVHAVTVGVRVPVAVPLYNIMNTHHAHPPPPPPAPEVAAVAVPATQAVPATVAVVLEKVTSPSISNITIPPAIDPAHHAVQLLPLLLLCHHPPPPLHHCGTNAGIYQTYCIASIVCNTTETQATHHAPHAHVTVVHVLPAVQFVILCHPPPPQPPHHPAPAAAAHQTHAHGAVFTNVRTFAVEAVPVVPSAHPAAHGIHLLLKSIAQLVKSAFPLIFITVIHQVGVIVKVRATLPAVQEEKFFSI